MLAQIPGGKPVTLGADKGYDTRDFVAECGNREVTPHVARNTKRSMGIAIAERTTRQPGYEISQKKRKRIEECCGWLKVHKVGRLFTFAADTRMPPEAG